MSKKTTDIVNTNEMELSLEIRKNTSFEKTPKKMIYQKGVDGFDYVKEEYMRTKLDHLYPDWSWLPAPNQPVQFLGSEWVITSGVLEITDEASQRKRRFYSPGAARIQFKKNQPHTAENVIDIDKQVASANSYAFKRAVNRATHIADDVYRKQVRLDFISDIQEKVFLSALKEAKEVGMPLTSQAKWKNSLDELYQSNFQDAMDTLLEEIAHLKKQNKTKENN
tara:strand:- start:5000 stop:5668 length:669 start_codon:yes stop_codon:yes gene_type:complete